MSWRIRDTEHFASGVEPSDIAQRFGLPLWVARVLHHRMRHWHDQSLEAVQRFLEPSLKHLPDPFLLVDMDRAADRLAEAVVEGEPVAIYGDYDVDGTVGTAVMRRFLRRLGVEPVVYQPDRQLEGYGVNQGAIEKLAADGIRLLITVDCGITSVKEVERANELGMDVIICDHHEPKEVLPPAYAVLDHKRADQEGPIRSLSGAGVAFYLAIATRSVLRDIGHFDSTPEPDVRELLDLVALATVADMVPLVDENRVLVKFGLERLRRSPTIGLAELLRVAGVKPEEVSPYHLGFILGPRVNASGRLGSANGALELLSTDDPSEARALAERLDAMNSERMRLQNEIAEAAISQAAALLEANPDLSALVLHDDHWHEGVIGIVASKVTEKFHRPAAVVTFQTHTGRGKGSVRSVGGLDMTAALESCADLLASFGGHKAAAGLNVERAHIAELRERFSAAVAEQVAVLAGEGQRILRREITADVELAGDSELNNAAVVALDRLAPFGMGNPEPVVLVSGWKVAGSKVLKERHLKIQLQSMENKSLEGFWANGSGRGEFTVGEAVDIACLPQINSFRNLNRLELKIKDIRAGSH